MLTVNQVIEQLQELVKNRPEFGKEVLCIYIHGGKADEFGHADWVGRDGGVTWINATNMDRN